MVDYGTDVDRLWKANAQGDLAIVSGLDNAEQAVYNRLMTKLGEMDWAEYHNYGCRSWEVLGSTDLEVAKQKIELYTTTALLQDPRVEDIYDISSSIDLNTARIDITCRLIGEDTATNIIITNF